MKKYALILALAMLLVLAGCGQNNTDGGKSVGKDAETETSQTENTDENEETAEVTVYFADKQAMYLEAETREVSPKDGNEAECVLEELIKGPESDELVALMPSDTEILSVKTEDGLCTVDLSAEFTADSVGASASETLLVYSVVNSLTALDGIDEVQFLIDGQKVEVFGGLIFDEPFSEDALLNKNGE